MSNSKPIFDHLPHTYNPSNRTVFRLQLPEYASVVHLAMQTTEALLQNNEIPDYADFLNNRGRRFVLRIRCEDEKNTFHSFVLKLFSLTRFRQKMRYHTKKFSQTRFGFGEANALLVAANRNLPVPNIYGHGLLKNRFGNPTLDMILMEHIHHHQTIGTLLNDARGNEEECKALLKRTTPLFVQLFHAGCNNIDMNLGTILLNSDGESKDYLLDFEYSRFHNEPNLTVLMSEAGFFAHRCQKNAALSADLMEWWFADLLTALHITDPAEKQHLKQQFNYYATHKLSRKERMNIQ